MSVPILKLQRNVEALDSRLSEAARQALAEAIAANESFEILWEGSSRLLSESQKGFIKVVALSAEDWRAVGSDFTYDSFNDGAQWAASKAHLERGEDDHPIDLGIFVIADGYEPTVSSITRLFSGQKFVDLVAFGARYGLAFMRDQIGLVPNDRLNFIPTFFVYKKKKQVQLVAVPDVCDCQESVLNEFFEKKHADAVLMEAPTWYSRTAEATGNPKPSSFPDRITVSRAQVYLAPTYVVAEAMVPVGTPEELQQAGFPASGMSPHVRTYFE
jgi:hypothetical protein